jgi:hypothetical protein
MSQKIAIYLFYGLKSFTPFSPFLVPYLIDFKKFKNKEIYNTMNVYFFVSSLIVALISFLIVRIFGNKLSLFIDTSIEIIACFLLMIMGDRDFLLGKIISCLHGSSTALNSVLKSVVVSNFGTDKHKNKELMSEIVILKYAASVISSWIGQDIYINTKSYFLNLNISIFTLICALLSALLIDDGNQPKDKASITKELKDNFSLVSDFGIMSLCLLSITANILVICLSFFSANVFIERRRCGRSIVTKYIFFFMTPFKYFSKLLINFFVLIGVTKLDKSEENIELKKKELVIHGYIDGIAKICSALICCLMVKIPVSDEYRFHFSLAITLCTNASLFLLYVVDSLSLSYLFFTISFSLSTSIKIILYTEFNTHPYKNFIFSFNMFVSSLIHISLSCLSIYKKSDIKQRFRYYFYVCLFLTCSSLVLYWLGNK